MKKLLLLGNLFALALIYLYSCSSTNIGTSNNGFQIDKSPVFASCYNCVVDDIHGETADEFADVTARYKTSHFETYNNYARGLLPSLPNTIQASNFEDARSCWYSIDTLKKFICLMEKYSSKSGITSTKLGVRFYYAAYPDIYQRDPALAKHHTLFLTATVDQAGQNVDFDPRVTASNGGKGIATLASLLNPNLSTYRTMPLFAIMGNPGNITMNQGDLCPPGTGCTNTLSAIDAIYPSPHN